MIEDDSGPKFVQRHFQHYTGWFKIWRQVLNNDIWATCPHSWFRVFFALIACARYDEQEVRIGGETIIAPPGSLTIGSHEFSLFCGITRQQLRSALEYLAAEKVITTKATARFTLVTICNWEAYQSDPNEEPNGNNHPNNQLGNQANNQLNNQPITTPITTSKEVKKYKKNTSAALQTHPVILDLARRVHSRHPQVRRGSLSEVVGQLVKIFKPVPEDEWLALSSQIDQSHLAACGQHSWQKDSGEFAKGLVNWLAPTLRRWEEPIVTGYKNGAEVAPKKLLTTDLYR